MSTCQRTHVVVTGTSSGIGSGIGRATVLRLAAAGGHVFAGVRRISDAPAAPDGGSGEITPLLRRGRGRVVLIGSIGTRFTLPFAGPLSASKSAVATMAEALRQELAPWDVGVVLIEPATIHTEAVDKLARNAERLLGGASSRARGLCGDDFRRFVSIGVARERTGSPPEVVARVVADALTVPRPRPRYLVGKDALPTAALAAVVPTRLLDTLRRKLAHQPTPGSRVVPEAAEANGQPAKAERVRSAPTAAWRQNP